MINLAGVLEYLWRFKDCALYLIVIKLYSYGTVNKVSKISNQDSCSIVVLWLALYFLHFRLYAVNEKVVEFNARIFFLWYFTICRGACPIIEKYSKFLNTNSGFSDPFIQLYWWTTKNLGKKNQYNLPVFAFACRDFS